MVPVYSGYRSIEPALSASSRMAVLPSPGLCAPPALWLTISPRMYDSVKRFEPAVNASAPSGMHADSAHSATILFIRSSAEKAHLVAADLLRADHRGIGAAQQRLAVAPVG